MAADARDGDGNFLRRWSQRKLAASRQAAAEPPPPVAAPAFPAGAGASVEATAPPAAASAVPAGAAAVPVGAGDVTAALPPVDSLRFDSDFTRFLAPKVDETVKRQALRKLFSDPRFNVMDGLDVYIDDYSKFEPIPEDLLGKLRHARYVFDPPQTRVNEAGHVEDVADEPPAGAAAADDGGAGAPDAAGDGDRRDVADEGDGGPRDATGDGGAGGQDAAAAEEPMAESPVAVAGATAPGTEAQDAAHAGTAAGDAVQVAPAAVVVARKSPR